VHPIFGIGHSYRARQIKRLLEIPVSRDFKLANKEIVQMIQVGA
jgi:hypothetical protein